MMKEGMKLVACLLLFVVHTRPANAADENIKTWVVQVDGDETAQNLARKHGFDNEGRVFSDFFSFRNKRAAKRSEFPNEHLGRELVRDRQVRSVEQKELKSSEPYFNDTLWKDEWYINGRDDHTYNIIDAWKQGYNGTGVVVAVVDEGLETNHTDLRKNYDRNASYDFVENDTIPEPSASPLAMNGHGTMCAGVIAAEGNNNFCGVGLAYKAKIGGIRLFTNKKATDEKEAKALQFNRNYIDIYSNSWGPPDKGIEVAGPGERTRQILKEGAEKGRGGLGSIFVFAAGNGGVLAQDCCSFDGYVNSIYTIAISGVNKDGSIAPYGERCPGIMAVTYSRSVFGERNKVITTDRDGKCSSTFGSSSAAAAMASGIIALTLQANKTLTWRDVQHIIVRSARSDVLKKRGWVTNKAGLKASKYFGFGLMDAKKMIEFAEKWRTVPKQITCSQDSGVLNRTFSWRNHEQHSISMSSCEIQYLEHVQVRLNVNFWPRGDLLVELMSPMKTVSRLTHYRTLDRFKGYSVNLTDWVITSLHHWGEQARGTWNLSLRSIKKEDCTNVDNSCLYWKRRGYCRKNSTFRGRCPLACNPKCKESSTGKIISWSVILYGTSEDPLKQNKHAIKPINENCDGKVEKSQCQYWKENNLCKTKLKLCSPDSFDIDECAELERPCKDRLAKCKNTIGSYQCNCPSGFHMDENNFCQDKDECRENSDGCQVRCRNTWGSYSCFCNNGFKLSLNKRTCVDKNECAEGSHGCQHRCRNTYGSYLCSCGAGFKLSPNKRTCIDKNECAEGSHGCQHRCKNTYGSYLCSCEAGFKLSPNKRTCIDKDECREMSHGCEHGCNNTYGSYSCVCNPGFKLSPNKKECLALTGRPLLNATSCEDDEAQNTCEEWKKRNLCEQKQILCSRTCGACGNETDVDECAVLTQPCKDSLATCENTIGSYQCKCPSGFQMDETNSCQDNDECATASHGCQHGCTNTPGSYFCFCNSEYKLAEDKKTCVIASTAPPDRITPPCEDDPSAKQYCQGWKDNNMCEYRLILCPKTCNACPGQTDVDECAVLTQPCKDSLATCENTIGSYQCKCPSGFQMDETNSCQDNDECATASHGCQHGCTNTPGSYFCFCNSEYKLAEDKKTCVIASTAPPDRITPPCEDDPSAKQYCQGWKDNNMCEYRLILCPKTCNACPGQTG